MKLRQKVKAHILNIAWFRNLRFTFFCILKIVARRIPLPQAIFKKPSLWEIYLKAYMLPKHAGCFVDVGANLAVWTVRLAKKGVTVHAFEPNPRSYGIVKEKAKGYPNVQVYPFALGQSNHTMQLFLHRTSGHDSLVNRADDFTGHEATVPVRTLDSFNLPNVGLIKIDTEGYEVPVLLGAKQTIAKHKPRLVIEVHRPYKEQIEKITRILEALNYSWLFWFQGGHAHHIISDPKGGSR